MVFCASMGVCLCVLLRVRVSVCASRWAWVCVCECVSECKHGCVFVCVAGCAWCVWPLVHTHASLKCTKLNCEQGFFGAVRKVRVILKLCKKLMCVLRSQKFAKALIYLTIYKLGLGLKRLG